jgi:D-aminopeptidase
VIAIASLFARPTGAVRPAHVPPVGLSGPFYTAVVEAVEEAVANALTANEEMVGRAGHRTPALPRDQVAALFRSPRPRG